MVQRILMLALCCWLSSMPTEAITLQELQTSPQFQISSCSGDESYDGARWFIYLFEHLFYWATHYAPQYSLRGTYYVVMDTDYQSTIEERQLTVDYDTNYSLATLIHSSHMMNPSPSTLALIEASESKSGLSLVDRGSCGEIHFDGATQQMQYRNDMRKFPLKRNNTIMYDIAEAMFMAAYQQYFDDIVVQ